MRFNNAPMIDHLTNVTRTSSALDTSQMMTGSFQATFTDGAASGTLVIQASNDPFEILPAGEPPQNWFDLSATVTSIASGQSALIPAIPICYRWLRASFTRSGGAGTFTVTCMLQGF